MFSLCAACAEFEYQIANFGDVLPIGMKYCAPQDKEHPSDAKLRLIN